MSKLRANRVSTGSLPLFGLRLGSESERYLKVRWGDFELEVLAGRYLKRRFVLVRAAHLKVGLQIDFLELRLDFFHQ